MGRLQEILKNTMRQVGALVEKIAHTAGKKSTAGKSASGSGLTESEGDFEALRWDERHIHALLTGAERRELFPLLPLLGDKKSLHLTPAHIQYIDMLQRRGAQDLVEMDVARASVATEAPTPRDHPFLRGAIEKMPFKSQSFDFILYPSALAWRSDISALIPELTRCVKENGRVVISVVHPFFEYMMNPRAGFRKNISTLFSDLKTQGFFIDELREGNLDDVLRHVSLPQWLTKDLRRFQGMPIVLLVRGIMLKKRKSA